MEGVVVTASKPGSIVEVSVTTDAQGRYSFPESRLDPGEYAISIRAVGYDIDSPAKATVAPEATTTADIRLKKTKNLASQLTNAEWMMSIPGTEEQKAELLNCVGCHTLERIARSTHNSDEWTQVSAIIGYGAVSQPIKPQPMLDRARAGTPEQYRKFADYLATINLSSTDHWRYELDAAAPERPGTRAIVTEYDMVRPRPSRMTSWSIRKATSGTRTLARCSSANSIRRRSSSPISDQKVKDKAPIGLLSIEFDHAGKIWFDTMYQGSLGRLDPKTGEISYYPLAPEYNDDRVQLNFTGLHHEVDGKVWTKSISTRDIFRLDLASNRWKKFHPTDGLPSARRHTIYQVMANSKNNLWMAEFTQGHLGKIDAKTRQVT